MMATLPGIRGARASSWGSVASRRSLWTAQRSEGEAMAAVALIGDDSARWSHGKEAEEGRVLEGERGEVEAVEGKCVALGDDSSSGKQAGGGRARAGVRWPRASVLLAEEGEDTGAPGGLGRQLGH